MSKPKPIKELINQILTDRKEQLRKEIRIYEEKMHDTESYYGFGGVYGRQEKAKEAREHQLEELEEFESQLRRAKPTKKLWVYAFGCRECGTACMTTKEPFDSWHECPTCRKMVYLENVPSMELEVTESCQIGQWLRRIVWEVDKE